MEKSMDSSVKEMPVEVSRGYGEIEGGNQVLI
jgi:hypothetical protein